MAKPIGTRPIPWLSDRDKLKQQFFEEVKFRLDNLNDQPPVTPGTIQYAEGLIGRGDAGGVVPAYRAVTSDNLGRIILASADILNHADRVLGISLNSALGGEEVIYVGAGEVENLGWAFPSETPIFLGIDGALVTNPSLGIYQTRIGHAKTPTILAVRIGTAIAF